MSSSAALKLSSNFFTKFTQIRNIDIGNTDQREFPDLSNALETIVKIDMDETNLDPFNGDVITLMSNLDEIEFDASLPPRQTLPDMTEQIVNGSMRNFDIANNALRCDCELQWLLDLLRDKQHGEDARNRVRRIDTRCDDWSGEGLRGRLLDDLITNETSEFCYGKIVLKQLL